MPTIDSVVALLDAFDGAIKHGKWVQFSKVQVGDTVLDCLAPTTVLRKNKNGTLLLTNGSVRMYYGEYASRIQKVTREQAFLILRNWELYRHYVMTVLPKREFAVRWLSS